ncbi:hypothetical protein EDB83DRAFT_323861 [Lactarius deliciosus]|nr:hypothetical protein EDB83DRAFT_323861 [Lactarius deliciosus]
MLSTSLPTIRGFHRENVLELVKELVNLHHPNLRLCITSRPEYDIHTTLEPLATQQVSLHDESGQKQDINVYVTFVVHSDRRMKRWREDDKDAVIENLTEKADVMFVLSIRSSAALFPDQSASYPRGITQITRRDIQAYPEGDPRNGVCPQDPYDEFWFERRTAQVSRFVTTRGRRTTTSAQSPCGSSGSSSSMRTIDTFIFSLPALYPGILYTVQMEATSDDPLTPEGLNRPLFSQVYGALVH